jgi:DNA sulfur modification protein DndD
MILRRLVVNNVRPYRGTAAVEFATDPASNVTLLHGVNGAGKTSLFLALNWVLYGSEVVKYSGHLINESALNSVPIGEAVTGSVSLEFEHDGEQFYASRGVSASRASDGDVAEKYTQLELFRIDHSGNTKSEQFAQRKISQMLPPAIRTFFFFDGDKIAEFTRPGNEQDKEITRAVNEVLQLDLLNRAESHLSQLAKAFKKAVAEHGDVKLKDLEARMERLQDIKTDLVNRRELVQTELTAVEKERDEIDERFQNIEAVAAKALQREQLEGRVKAELNEINRIKRELMAASVRGFSLPAKSALERAEDILDEKRKRNQIPSDYKDTFLRDLLESEKCICERPLEAGSSAFEHIERLLQQVVPNSIQNRALVLHSEISRLVKEQPRHQIAILGLLKRLEEALKALDEVQHEKEQIDAELAGHAAIDIGLLQQRRKALESERDSHQFDLVRVGNQLEQNNDAFERMEREFREESARQKGLAVLAGRARLASDAEKEFESIRERLVSDLKGELSEEATRIFKSFTWKDDFFKRIEVGEHYLLKLFDVGGHNLRSVMSMGETQLLSLAFILSMTEISDHVAPLVIDTPLARLDRTVRINLVRALPNLTRQLVLLCTDSEMSLEVKSEIAPRVGKEYLLTFEDGISTIQEGAF